MEEYNSIQQLLKKEGGKKNPVFPPTVVQAVFDAKTGASLEAILAQFNSVYLPYQGTPQATRLIIPKEMRRAGLTITYMNMDSETITERAASAVQKDNDHWGLDINWSRVDELTLSGDISVSAQGTWIINGSDTGVKAVGPKGDAGLTPWLRTIDNRLHLSYDNVTWEPCSDPIAAYFRWSSNKIQISRDNKTWTDLSGTFADNLYIKGYVATTSSLPSSAAQGDIYGVGPTYAAEDTARTNPIYRYYVRNAGTWVDNGPFTSIAAGIVQETGDSENVVMSQKAVTEKLSELGSKVIKTNFSNSNLLNNYEGVVKEQIPKKTTYIGLYNESGILEEKYDQFRTYSYDVTEGQSILLQDIRVSNWEDSGLIIAGFWENDVFVSPIITSTTIKNIEKGNCFLVTVPKGVNNIRGVFLNLMAVSFDNDFIASSKNTTKITQLLFESFCEKTNVLANAGILESGSKPVDSLYYITSKTFEYGGIVKSIQFSDLQYDKFANKNVSILVGIINDEGDFILTEKVEVLITDKDTDLSSYNIRIPRQGAVGFVDELNKTYLYYGSTSSTDVTTYYRSTTAKLQIGDKYQQYKKGKLIFPYIIEVEQNVIFGADDIKYSIKSIEEQLLYDKSNSTELSMPPFVGNGRDVTPPDWLTSKIIKGGGSVTKAIFYEGSEELQGKTGYIVVATLKDDDTAILVSRTPFVINGNEVDLSSYNIELPPNGLVGINFNERLFTYGYTTERPTDFTDEIFIAASAKYVGREMKRSPSFKYLNFPFAVEYIEKETLSKKIYELDKEIENINEEIDSKTILSFEDKKICIFGDSITWLSISGNPNRGWVTHFLNLLKFKKSVNYARSGATWSNTVNTEYNITENTGSVSDNNVIYNQFNRLLNDISNGSEVPDYIIIAAGTNDAWYPSSRPDALSKTAKEVFEDESTDYLESVNINQCTSIAQAFRYVAEMIIKNLPNAKVVVCTPLQSTAFTADRNKSITEVIASCANYMSWNVIVQSEECGVSRLQEKRGYKNTYDGTHTSEEGAILIGSYLANKFMSLFGVDL